MAKFTKHGIEWVTADEDLESETPRYLSTGLRKGGVSLKKKASFAAKKAKKGFRSHAVVRAKKASR